MLSADTRGRLDAVLESIAEGVVIFDAQGNVLQMNREARRLHGFESTDQVRRHLKEFPEFELRTLDGDPIAIEDWPLARVLRGERFEDYHAMVVNRATGASSIWRYAGAPVSEGGSPTLGVLTIVDVTEEVRARERIAKEYETTQLLLQAADSLNRWTDLDSLLSGLAEVVLRSVEHRRVIVTLISEEGPSVRLAAVAGEAALPPGSVVPLDTTSTALREALATGGTRLIDYDALPEEQTALAREMDMRLVLAAPLSYRGRTLGLIVIDDPGRRSTFSQREIEIAEGIAAQAAIAVDNARLFEAERDHASDLQVLLEVSELVSSSLEPADVIDRALEAAERHLGVLASSVWVTEADGRRLSLLGARGFPQAFFEDFVDGIGSGEPFPVAVAVRQTAPVVYEHVGSDSGIHDPVREAYGRYGIRLGSLAALPLVARGRAIGGLTLAWGHPRRFDRQDLSFITALAGEFSNSLESARLFEVEREARAFVERERRQLEAVFESMEEAVGIWSPDGRQIAVNDATARLHGYPSKEAMLRRLDDFGEVEIRSMDGRTLPRDEWPAARVLRGETYSDWELEVLIPVNGVRFIGSYSGTVVADDEGDMLLAVITIHDVTAIRDSARLSDALNEIDTRISASLQVDSILASVVEMTARAIDADCAAIYVPVQDGWEARFTWRTPEWLEKSVLSQSEIPFSGRAARQGGVVHEARPEEDPAWEGSIPQRIGVEEIVDVALKSGDEVVGDLAVYRTAGAARRSSPQEVDFVRKVAASVSLALRNAQLYEAERKVADTLQEALLTIPDSIPGLEFAHSYRSATEIARVGGDFYDVFELERGRVAVTIGDVAGKGLNASVLTSLVKNAIRAQALEPGRAPAETMRTVNTLVGRSSEPEVFVTVFFGVLDRRKESLSYCNAGHTAAALVKSEDGVSERLTADSPIVGAFSDAAYSTGEVRMGEGDLLLLYTDGLTEARSPLGEFLQEDRVFEILNESAGASASDVVQRLVDEVARFTGDRLTDDMAILALRPTAEEG